MPILRDPTFIDRADLLIMESTYGGKTHPPITESAADMMKIIEDLQPRPAGTAKVVGGQALAGAPRAYVDPNDRSLIGLNPRLSVPEPPERQGL